LRILIVEDDALIAFAAEDVLVEGGHTVVGCAATRESALRLAATLAPEIALIDLRLADGDSGWDLARELSARTVRSIIASALPPSGTDSDPSLPFLTKPYTPAQLLAAVLDAGRGIRRAA
jgi:DNA-binding response OmpR family regulator